MKNQLARHAVWLAVFMQRGTLSSSEEFSALSWRGGDMGIFDEKLDRKEFDRFQREIKAELDRLSRSIESKVTDSEEDARQSAERAKALLAEVESSKSSIDNNVQSIEYLAGEVASKSQELVNAALEAMNQKGQIQELYEESNCLKSEVTELKGSMSATLSESSEKLHEITENLAQCAGLPEKLTQANSQISQLQEKFNQVEEVLNHAAKRKGQIDELHRSILGHDIKTEEGDIEHVDGLKEELEAAYSGLDERIQNLTSEMDRAIEGVNGSFKDLLEESSAEYDAVSNKLKSLLPDALAAGLSAAYEKKKAEEEILLEKSNRLFYFLIFVLVLISCIPFAVDFYLLFIKKIPLLDVLRDTPKLLITMLPLYFPILWLAYSTNKKSNLSKRIIEEYTHKSVLGRTYEGLSNQINSMPNSDGLSDELRVKLLLNILHVSAENPGKLISDYNKSDHPLMEALENSEKLGSSISKLENLPGFASLVTRLSSKSKQIQREAESLVEKGLEASKALNE